MTDRRLIEDSLPLAEISEQSAREKSIRQGNISGIHLWWARRPLPACRAAVYAALAPAPESPDERESQHSLIRDISNWDHLEYKHPMHSAFAEASHRLRSYSDSAPKVLDPFSGGGAIPLEAARLGCAAYANDLNPVAHVVEFATLKAPQALFRHAASLPLNTRARKGLLERTPEERAKEFFDACVQWISARAGEKLSALYPEPAPGKPEAIGFIWARVMACGNPACRQDVPLVRSWVLANRGHEVWHIEPDFASKSDKSSFSVRCMPTDPAIPPTVDGANLSCPFCGEITAAKAVRDYARNSGFRYRMLAAIEQEKPRGKKHYRSVTECEISHATHDAAVMVKALEALPPYADGTPVVIDEPMPPRGTLGFRVNNYGMRSWRDIYLPRQLCAVTHFAEAVASLAEASDSPAAEAPAEAREAVCVLMACALAKMAVYNTSTCRWQAGTSTKRGEFPVDTFGGGQKLSMTWDFVETTPLGFGSGSWATSAANVWGSIEPLLRLNPAVEIHSGSADDLSYPDAFFDAVVTDPPYYDAVPYSDLSDFFYGIHRRALRTVFPNLFSGNATPKRREIVENKGHQKDRDFFESRIAVAFSEIARVLKDDGPAVIVFAHKDTRAWETLIRALLSAGLVVSASWPLETERPGRLRAKDSAALSSSVFIACHKRRHENEGFLDDVEPELKTRLHERLDYFWSQGIRGADFFMSAIGPAVEVFGRHKRVLKLSGEEVTIAELLDRVRGIVADYALQRIVHGEAAGDVDEASRFYVIWRWAFGTTEVDSGEAIHMAQSMGCEFNELVADRGVLHKKGDKVNLKVSLDRKKIKGLGDPAATGTRAPLIDVLHRAANLWAAGERQELADFLGAALPAGGADHMQRLAQSIVDVLPPGDKERALYENFLVGSRSLPAPTQPVETADPQMKLF